MSCLSLHYLPVSVCQYMTVSFYRYRRPARTLTRPTAPERPPVIRRPAAGTTRYRPPAPPPTTVSISRVWGEGGPSAGRRLGQPATDHQRRHRPQSVSAGSGGRGGHQQAGGWDNPLQTTSAATDHSQYQPGLGGGEGASAGRDNPLQTTSAATDHSQLLTGAVLSGWDSWEGWIGLTRGWGTPVCHFSLPRGLLKI